MTRSEVSSGQRASMAQKQICTYSVNPIGQPEGPSIGGHCNETAQSGVIRWITSTEYSPTLTSVILHSTDHRPQSPAISSY